MIATLRRRHRAAVGAGSIILPGLLLAALATRAPTPTVASLPVNDAAAPPPDAPVREQHTRGGTVCSSSVTRDRVHWRCRGTPLPDLVAYLTRSRAALTELPEDAQFLGPAGTDWRSHVLPADATQLLFYSAAHRELVASVPLTTN